MKMANMVAEQYKSVFSTPKEKLSDPLDIFPNEPYRQPQEIHHSLQDIELSTEDIEHISLFDSCGWIRSLPSNSSEAVQTCPV